MSKTVAVIGASNDRRKFGNRALRAFQEEGYRVIPINPHESVIEGIQAYPSVLDVPEPIDMATVYVQPSVTDHVIDEVEQKGIPEVWVNPGAESDTLLRGVRGRKTRVILACSIIGIGRSPDEF